MALPQRFRAGGVRRVGAAAGRRSAMPRRTASWQQTGFCGWTPPYATTPETPLEKHLPRPVRALASAGTRQHFAIRGELDQVRSVVTWKPVACFARRRVPDDHPRILKAGGGQQLAVR